MIRSKRGLISIGAIAFVLGLIVLLPARSVYDWLAPPGVLVGGIEGTVWSGTAREASISGVYLQSVRWQIKPSHLLTGKLSYHVTGNPVSGFLESDVSVGIGGDADFTSLNAALPLEGIADIAGVRGLRGDASLQFDRIELVDGIPVAADGELQVANLLVPYLDRDSLGGYKAEFFTQNNGITASIEDTDGIVDLAGSLQIGADRTFQFLGQVVAKPETPAGIKQQFQFLGPANDRGQHELRLEGTLGPVPGSH